MNHAVVSGAVRVRRFRTGYLYYLLLIIRRRQHRHPLVSADPEYSFSPTFLADREERRAFRRHSSRWCHRAPVFLKSYGNYPKDCLICIEKTLRIRDSSHTSIRVLTPIFPGEDPAISNDAFRICRVRPEMYQVRSVAHPLIKDSR